MRASGFLNVQTQANRHVANYVFCLKRPSGPVKTIGKKYERLAEEQKRNIVCDLAVVNGKTNLTKKETLCAVSKYASDNEIPQLKWDQLKNQPELAGKYELAVVASFGAFIPGKIIKQFSRGAINIHPSLLPRWRGAAPLVHTILSGDTITGLSFIEVSPKKFDVGQILYQEKMEVPQRCTTEKLRDVMSSRMSDLLPFVLRNLSELRSTCIEQDETEATYAPKVTKELGYINPSKHSCAEIDRMYRALSGRGGIQILWDDKHVKLGEISEARLSNNDDAPYGTYKYSKREKLLWIKAKDGWIGVNEFQVEKKKKVINTSSFYNGYIVDKQSGKPKDISFRVIPMT